MTFMAAKKMMMAGGGVVDPDAARIVGAMTPRPNNKQSKRIDQTVQALKSAGVWQKLTHLYMPFLAPAMQGARLDWITGNALTGGASATHRYGQGIDIPAFSERMVTPILEDAALPVDGSIAYGTALNSFPVGASLTPFGTSQSLLQVSRDSNGVNRIQARVRGVTLNPSPYGGGAPRFSNLSLTRSAANSFSIRGYFAELGGEPASARTFVNTGNSQTTNSESFTIPNSNTNNGVDIKAFWAARVALTDADCANLNTLFGGI